MKLVATEDVPQPVLEDLCRELAGAIDIEIDEGRFSFKSLEAPSWIRLLAEAEWWQQGFAAIATLYVAELVKEAAKET